MIKIITDSTAYLPKEFAKENDITVLPLTVTIDNQEFSDTDTAQYDVFFERVEKSNSRPQSSQPNVELVTQAFKKVLDEGNEAIAICISKTLSGTASTFEMVKNELDTENKISVIDSGTVCQNIFLYIKQALKMVNSGKPREEVCKYLTDVQKTSFVSFIPENLDSLKQGGRIGKVNYFIGHLLKIKPILLFKQGILTCTKKIIGMKNAITALIKSIPKNIKEIMVLKISKSIYYDELKQSVEKAFPNIPLSEGIVGPAVGTHVGKAIGISCLVEE